MATLVYIGSRKERQMQHLFRGSRRVVSIVLGLVCVGAVTAGAQARKPAAAKPSSTSSAPPTLQLAPDGHPDLDGIWDFAQLTPFERPGDFAGKSSFTEDEAEEFAQQRLETGNKDRRDGGAAADVERAYNDFWWDFGTRVSKQTSLVVDPPDGRVPARTPEAEQRITGRKPLYDNPEERPLPERCILGFNSGPPMVPSAYNNNVQLFQTPDSVAIVNEMFARKFFAGANPVGRTFRLEAEAGKPEPLYQIVGLVKNTKYYEVREDFLPIGFFPIAQDDDPGAGVTFVLRTSGSLGEVMGNVKTAVAEVSPAIGIEFRPLSEQLQESLVSELLLKLGTMDPFQFEKVVLHLLVKMGYGGSFKEAAAVTQKTGDEGIDGVINQDRLGLDVIYVQAKRWKASARRFFHFWAAHAWQK